MLPDHVKSAVDEHRKVETAATLPTLFCILGPPLPDPEDMRALLKPFSPTPRSRSRSLSPTTSHHSKETPCSTFNYPDNGPAMFLFKIRVPVYPPSNAEVAELWSKTLWPVTFNPAAAPSTVVPPPQVLSRAQKSIEPRAGYYLALAREIAKESKQSGRGRGVGAVIVDPDIEARIDSNAWEEGYNSRERWMQAVIAVAGDCRYARPEAGGPFRTTLKQPVRPTSKMYDSNEEGGPDLHALMRAIELVARVRRGDPDHQVSMAGRYCMPVVFSDPQLSEKLSPFEEYFLYEAGNHIIPGDSTSSLSSTPTSSLSPRKRKLDEPNLEVSSSLDGQAVAEQPSSTFLPAPPPSTATALPDSTSSQLLPGGQDDSSLAGLRIRTRAQGGYLCTDLDVYLSHEPCLCCSMGVLLSRFRAVIFPRTGRMECGGLASEPIVRPSLVQKEVNPDTQTAPDDQTGNGTENPDRPYYGLHWRKELNWRALGFEFVEDETDDNFLTEGTFHA